MTRRGAVAIGVVGAIVLSGAVWARVAPPDDPAVPTAEVRRGTVEATVTTQGDLRATRSAQLAAPAGSGTLTIVALVPTGTAVAAGDVIVEFDAAEQVFALEQARFDLALAEQDIAREAALAEVQDAEDAVALLQARYAVRRAELDASGNELVGAVVAKQNLLLLDEARQTLAQRERDIASRREASRAAADALVEQRNKARLAVAAAERAIDTLVIRAPFAGHVIVRPNFGAFGGIVFSGAVMPEYRVGDSPFPGQPVADLVDTTAVEVAAKLPEHDRANVEPGQAVTVEIDAVPGLRLDGSVRAVSSVASRRVFEAGGTRQFDIVFDIPRVSQGVWPGASGRVTITGATFEDALFVPRAAVFDTAGRSTVFVRTPAGFEAREVTVRAWTDTWAIVDDLDAGAVVALVDPTRTNGEAAESVVEPGATGVTP